MLPSMLKNGIKYTKNKKYIPADICPNSIYGDSTCLAPNTINITKLATKIKNITFSSGLNSIPFNLPKSNIGKLSSINIALNIAITPNNLLGIDLRIA
jgi:hypothetical protein